MTNASLWGRQHHTAPTENVQDYTGRPRPPSSPSLVFIHLAAVPRPDQDLFMTSTSARPQGLLPRTDTDARSPFHVSSTWPQRSGPT